MHFEQFVYLLKEGEEVTWREKPIGEICPSWILFVSVEHTVLFQRIIVAALNNKNPSLMEAAPSSWISAAGRSIQKADISK